MPVRLKIEKTYTDRTNEAGALYERKTTSERGKWIIFLVFFTVCNLQVAAQLDRGQKGVSNYYPDYVRPGYSSVFGNLKTGDFPGTLSGVLFLQKNGSSEITQFVFRKEKASLYIEYDPEFVYDVSRKHHLFKRDDIQLRYTTYFLANCLEVIIGKDTVKIDMIDGASDVVINHLEWTYSADENTERLYLYTSTDIGLWKRRTRISSYVIKAGSLLCFDISRKEKKGK